RTLSFTYDLTPYLQVGENCLLAILAGGWWRGRIAFGEFSSYPMAFIASLVYTDAAGEHTLVTDEAWDARIGGPVLLGDIWDGEVYDARRCSFAKLSQPGTVCGEWKKPSIFTAFTGEISPHIGPTIGVRDGLSRTAVSYTLYAGVKDNGTDFGEIIPLYIGASLPRRLMPGQTLILDLGQNMVGHLRIRGRAAAGTGLLVRHAEMCNDSGEKSRGNDGPKGSIYTANYRSAKAKNKYIFGGDPAGEDYAPTFSFFGFRYVELTADAPVELQSLVAEVIGNRVRETGFIKTSDPEVNQLISNTLWGQRGNYLSIPTDCPQRDERLGWTGDTQVFCRTAAYNGDVLGFFHKWLQDMRDSQSEAGAYPDVAPRVRVVGEGAAAWGDAGIIVPHTMYTMYGDKTIIEEHFASMEKYMEFLASRGMQGPIARYGDWLAYEPTAKEYLSVVYYAYDAHLMAEMADIIGRVDRAAHYRDLHEKIVAHFRATYMPEGELTQTSQCAYLLALAHDLLPEEKREAAKSTLLQKIRDNGYRLSTGFIGTAHLAETLSAIGAPGMAYSLLLQTENPSWLYSVRQGATTIWERWNSYTLATGFGDVGMNSFNHYAYGCICGWMYRYMAGIDTAEPGFTHILLRPQPDLRTDDELPAGQHRITHVNAAFDGPTGRIETAWSTEAGNLRFSALIPTAATLHLPLCGKSAYTVNGEAGTAEMVKDGCAIIELAAGRYEFTV
ncbi:MAG: family 78 glycoside hydrolase catalytic domain, partial [Clostridia bacterium]|nr:family 78 glycoside hydrolase catalytic domain [Clostridia bacterium]